MVDVVLSLTGPDRSDRTGTSTPSRGTASCRSGTPDELQLAAIPEIDDWGHSLEDYRTRAAEHIARVQRATGDWRPAMDGLRTVVQALWQRLDESDRDGVPARRRQRLGTAAPPDASRLGRRGRRARGAPGLLTRSAGEVVDAEPLTGGGLRVTLSDGSVRDVGWVVNCTGTSTVAAPGRRPAVRRPADPARRRGARSAEHRRDGAAQTTAGGSSTRPAPPRRRSGRSARVRRGELWESTAIPEIRTQAAQVAAVGARRGRPGAATAGRRPARRRSPPDRPAARPARAAAVDHGRGRRGVQRRASSG